MREYDPRSAQASTYLIQAIRASELAAALQGDLIGTDTLIKSVATYTANIDNSISYQTARSSIAEERERVVLCTRENEKAIKASTKIIVDDPREAYLKFLSRAEPDWDKTTREQFDALQLEHGLNDVHHTAVIENGVVIGKGCTIEPYVIIKRGSIVGEYSYISANSVLGTHGPALYKARTETISYLRLHFGTLQILNNVEVGNSCVILKGLLGRTLLGENSVLGNMVHVGHGAEIRDHVWMAANVTVCGHALIDSYTSIGAGSVIRDNIIIGHNASIGMGSVVVKDVKSESSVLGVPAREIPTPAKSGPIR